MAYNKMLFIKYIDFFKYETIFSYLNLKYYILIDDKCINQFGIAAVYILCQKQIILFKAVCSIHFALNLVEFIKRICSDCLSNVVTPGLRSLQLNTSCTKHSLYVYHLGKYLLLGICM